MYNYACLRTKDRYHTCSSLFCCDQVSRVCGCVFVRVHMCVCVRVCVLILCSVYCRVLSHKDAAIIALILYEVQSIELVGQLVLV